MAVPTKCAELQLTKNDGAVLFKILSNSSDKWNNIGIELGFLISELKQIRLSQSLLTGAPHSYLKELLYQWLEWPTDIHPDLPTLKALCNALRSSLVGQKCLADELEEKMKQYFELQEPTVPPNHAIMIELFGSIKRGNIGHIDFMLEKKGIDINYVVDVRKKIETALIVACRVGNPATVRKLLAHRAEINLQTSTGKCALMEACRYGNTDVVSLLLKNGAQINLQAEDGTSSLMIASLEGHIDIIKILLNHGAKVDLRAIGNESAFILASQNGQIEVIKFFLKCDQISIEEKDMYAAMLFASQSGHIEIVNLLFKLAAKEDQQTYNGGSALVAASQYGHTDIVKTLLKCGVIVDFQENGKETALMAACQNGHTKVVELLLKYNAMVNLQQSNGCTALMLASQHGFTKITEILLEHGAAVNLHNKNGVTALMMAGQNGHNEIVKLLHHQNAKVDIRDNKGFSALLYASENGHTEVVKLLLDYGAHPDGYTNSGMTPLMLACFNGHFEVVKLLVEQGANIYLQAMDESFRLARTFAEEKGHRRIVNFLKNQADFKDMFKILIPIANKWKSLGTLLDIDDAMLNAIDTESKDDEDGLRHMLKEWLKFTDPPPTLKSLAEAASVFNKEIAKALSEL